MTQIQWRAFEVRTVTVRETDPETFARRDVRRERSFPLGDVTAPDRRAALLEAQRRWPHASEVRSHATLACEGPVLPLRGSR